MKCFYNHQIQTKPTLKQVCSLPQDFRALGILGFAHHWCEGPSPTLGTTVKNLANRTITSPCELAKISAKLSDSIINT